MQIVKVYGPYSRKEDKRKVVVLKLADGKLTTKSYARYLYEIEHGFINDVNLTVDHIDENEQNDTLDNFQLLTREENIKKSAKKPIIINFVCSICGSNFKKFLRIVNDNIKKNKAGPFCSKRCAGIWSANKQYGQKEELILTCAPIVIE